MKVLIVDDEPTIRGLLRTMLAFEGLAPMVAADGKAAVEMAQEDCPDVVFVDLMMPGMDGYEVCRRLKAMPGAPKVVMLTAKTSSDDEARGYEAGADAFLRKPFSPVEVMRLVGIGGDAVGS